MLMQLRFLRSGRGKDFSLRFCQSMGRPPDKADRCACSGRQIYAKRYTLWRHYTASASPGCVEYSINHQTAKS
jgi:hypothetical protein